MLFARGGPDSTILDGEGNKQLFTIDTQNDTTLKIIGFTIQNGGGDFGGAAVSVAGVYVGQTNGNDNYNPSGAVFENCVIKDSDSQSPAILVENGGGAIFRNCIIKNNRNHNNGSGQLDGAGIKVQQQGKLILDRTKVLDNYTENTGNGGEFHRGSGVYADNSAIYVINSIIADNYTASWNNGSSNYGSGLYAWNAELAIINSTITGNQGIANQSSGSGSALEIGGSDGEQIVIFNSIIAGNINRNAGGGGIVPSAVQTYIQQNSGQYVAITNSIFEGGSFSFCNHLIPGFKNLSSKSLRDLTFTCPLIP